MRLLERVRGRRPGRIVDVGCAYGFFLEVAPGRGWEAVGVDVSAHARARASAAGLGVAEDLL